MVHLRFASDEDLTDQALESLCQCRVRDIALVLVELAGRKEPVLQDKRLVQLVHHRGFSDAGRTRYEDEFAGALSRDPIERCKQSLNLAFPPIQLLRNQQSF